MSAQDWSDAVGGGYFSQDVADYLSEDIDDPRTIERMDASWDGAGWEITIDHGDDLSTTYTINDTELPDWWWDDLYWWAEELGIEWELNYEES